MTETMCPGREGERKKERINKNGSEGSPLGDWAADAIAHGKV